MAFTFVGLICGACAAPVYLNISVIFRRVSVFVVLKVLGDVAFFGKNLDIIYLTTRSSHRGTKIIEERVKDHLYSSWREKWKQWQSRQGKETPAQQSECNDAAGAGKQPNT